MEMTYTETLVVTDCWCGIHLAVPANLLRWAKNNSSHAIFCPLGHEFVFSDDFKTKYERERKRAQANLDLLHAEERSHIATRGHLTRTKKRVAAGVCPCCNRTFQNLARHMKGQHPEYAEAVT
jgi:hypothetical protein